MRILVTGASGFVGQWLVPELDRGGHEVVVDDDGRRVEVADAAAVERWIGRAAPDAVVHLAAVSARAAVDADPGRALRVTVGGTANVVAALGRGRHGGSAAPVLLVAGSGDVYGAAADEARPLRESTLPRPTSLYGMTKLAQETVAIELGRAAGVRVVATRSFNHTGPGQSASLVVPAFADRIVRAAAEGRQTIQVGNIDVVRDVTDVRDVVVAYRLLVEAAARGATPPAGLVVNVASGTSVLLRDLVARLATIVGVPIDPIVDPSLVRASEPVEIGVDIRLIRETTGWRPAIPIDTTLRDVVASVSGRARVAEA